MSYVLVLLYWLLVSAVAVAAGWWYVECHLGLYSTIHREKRWAMVIAGVQVLSGLLAWVLSLPAPWWWHVLLSVLMPAIVWALWTVLGTDIASPYEDSKTKNPK